MAKKFVIKPWMIITVSTIIIGSVITFFVLNNKETTPSSTPNNKLDADVRKVADFRKAAISKPKYKSYLKSV